MIQVQQRKDLEVAIEPEEMALCPICGNALIANEDWFVVAVVHGLFGLFHSDCIEELDEPGAHLKPKSSN